MDKKAVDDPSPPETEYVIYVHDPDLKQQFFDGQTYVMTGVSSRHAHIVVNLLAHLHAQLQGRDDCFIYSTNLRLRLHESGIYCYPDVMIVCGEEQFESDDYTDTLLNPNVIIEVASPHTAGDDYGKRWEYIRRLPSVQHYVLIQQYQSNVEVYTRLPEGVWSLFGANEINAILSLDKVDVTLNLAKIYDRLQFDGYSPPPYGYKPVIVANPLQKG